MSSPNVHWKELLLCVDMLKKYSLLFLLIFTSNSFAASTAHIGPYLGLQGGYGLSDEGNGYSKHLETFAAQASGNKTFKKETGGSAGRIFLGYDFAKYFSLEAGGTLFSHKHYNYDNSTLPQLLHMKTRTYTIDLVGKFILPLKDSPWNIYAKLGGAYVDFVLVGTALNIPGNSSATKHYSALCPAYGLGMSYNINENIAIDVSWLGTYSNNRFHADQLDPDAIKPVPTTNIYVLGITYKFK